MAQMPAAPHRSAACTADRCSISTLCMESAPAETCFILHLRKIMLAALLSICQTFAWRPDIAGQLLSAMTALSTAVMHSHLGLVVEQ